MKANQVVLFVRGVLLPCIIDCKDVGVVCCTHSRQCCSVYLLQGNVVAYLAFNFACNRTALYLDEYAELTPF